MKKYFKGYPFLPHFWDHRGEWPFCVKFFYKKPAIIHAIYDPIHDSKMKD